MTSEFLRPVSLKMDTDVLEKRAAPFFKAMDLRLGDLLLSVKIPKVNQSSI